jgi:hypothetical protein
MNIKNFTPYDWFRTLIVIVCVGYAFVFLVWLWVSSIFGMKMIYLGLSFALLGIAFNLQSSIETEQQIRNLVTKE